jgi:hypothetical protein
VDIDPDVQATATHFGVDAGLIQAVVDAEGNIVRAVQCSIPASDPYWSARPEVTDRVKALEVTCRSAVHAMSDFMKTMEPTFVKFWAARWAPRGATNDPHNLNANWPGNVQTYWAKLG